MLLLRRCGLYSLVYPPHTLCTQMIADKVRWFRKTHGHKCAGGSACPLIVALEGLWEELKEDKLGPDQVKWSYKPGQADES